MSDYAAAMKRWACSINKPSKGIKTEEQLARERKLEAAKRGIQIVGSM